MVALRKGPGGIVLLLVIVSPSKYKDHFAAGIDLTQLRRLDPKRSRPGRVPHATNDRSRMIPTAPTSQGRGRLVLVLHLGYAFVPVGFVFVGLGSLDLLVL